MPWKTMKYRISEFALWWPHRSCLQIISRSWCKIEAVANARSL
jgi:hypothetical protein